MDDAFEIPEPHSAQAFLAGLPSEARRKGEALFRAQRVHKLQVKEDGTSFSALVKDGVEQEILLSYDDEMGWEGDCSCELAWDCEHVCAGMSALLAEHRYQTTNQLVQNAAASKPASKPAAPPPKPAEADLAGMIKAATGRNPSAPERQFLNRLHELYIHCARVRHIAPWDFQQLGLPLKAAYHHSLEIWPAFPADEHEFWLYIANAVFEGGSQIPDFMLPITDLGPIQERLAKWRRSREILAWREKFTDLPAAALRPSDAPVLQTELRLMITSHEALPQWQRPGQNSFDRLKASHATQLASDHDHGRLNLDPEAHLLWQVFSRMFHEGRRFEWTYMDSEATRLLGSLLRSPQLESRIVDAEGQPLARPEEPLRWELDPADDEHDDYRLRLVQNAGAAAPPVLCILPGRPALYLTQHTLFRGPAHQKHLLDPAKENRIPAPAIEHATGIAFLQSLGVEAPARVRERIRLLPYAAAVSCRLRPSYRGSENEECVISLTAEAPDGRHQTWTGYNWLESSLKNAKKAAGGAGNDIVLYDSARLTEAQTFIEGLNTKPSTFDNCLTFRVTKKFPEVFSAWIKTAPPWLTLQLDGDLASFLNPDVAGRVKLDVTEAEIDWFDLRVVLDVADTTLTADEIKLLLNAKGAFVRLEGKGWKRLQYNFTEEENERFARLGLSPHELTDEPQRLHALQLADEAAKKFLPATQVESIERRVGELKARVSPELPAGVTAQLRPYQLEGFHFLAYLSTNRFGGILADDMGLGKTLQALSWLVWLRESEPEPRARATGKSPAKPMETGHPPSLVVCPKSVMDNWQAEAIRFTPGLRVRRWGPGEIGLFTKEMASADLHVLNYSQLRALGESLAPLRWLAVILDEGQYIKNPNSQTTQVARALNARHRLVLSGTPIENRLLDLWSLMSFAMPGVLSSRAQFARLYDTKGDPFARRRLASRVRPFVLRRTKTQVAKDLPDRIEEDLFCEIEGEQKTLYRAELKRAQQLLLGVKTQRELAKQQFHFLTSLLRLRQICCDPRLAKPDAKGPGAKTEALLEQLEPLMEEGEKVLVFSQFVEMLNLLRPAIEERGWPVFYLAGDTENRGELVRKFQEAEGPGVFLISLKAGGFGLNLTAASYVILFDPWWNPAVENQAIDRTHRIGQVNKVIAYRLLIKDSIEEKIRALQKQKSALAQDVLGEEKFAQSLTLNDLHFLFAD